MNIFIIGAGEIGSHLALFLAGEKHNITVFEQNAERCLEIGERLDGRMINADGASAGLLAENGVGECDLFISVTSHNHINLVACRIAKEMGARKALCRAHSDMLADEWLFDYRGHFNIDYLFSPERLAAVNFAKYIRNPVSVDVEEIARGRISLQSVKINEKAPAVGVPLKSLKLPPRTRLATIEREGKSIVPSANDALMAGDNCAIFGSPQNISKAIKKMIGKDIERVQKKVVIYSASDYGVSLAQLLAGMGCQTRIFEKNPEKCEQISAQISSAEIIHADATSLAILKEEQIGEADFFIACSLKDEDNLMTCIQAKNLGVKRCLTLVHRADYAEAIIENSSSFGILGAVSPRDATRRDLIRFITSDLYHEVKKIPGGYLIEASVRAKSKLRDKQIKQLSLPKQTVIVALIQGARAAVPSPDDTLNVGDVIYVYVSDLSRKNFVKLL